MEDEDGYEGENFESAAIIAINAAVEDNTKLLQKAIIRKNRALQSLSNADRDISVYSGAIMALEDVTRRLRAAQKEGGAKAIPAPPQPPPKMYITLSGEQPYVDSESDQTMSDLLQLKRR